MSQTPSMRLGSATHELLAQKIDPNTVLEYSVNNRNLGEFSLTATDMMRATKMADNAFKMFGHLLDGSEVEGSNFATYMDKVDVKCRPDYLLQDQGIIYDLKTIQRLTDRDVAMAIKTFHYDISAAFYILVMGLLGVTIRRFRLIFVESTGIGLVRMFEFSARSLETATTTCLNVLNAQVQHANGMPFDCQPTLLS